MSTKSFTSLRDFARAFTRDTKAREGRVRNAVRKTARQTRNYVARTTIPRAFGELADSLHVVDGAKGNSDVTCDAPHAAAVENGSRPHTPPLAPLIAWVTLRGLQGLTSGGRVKALYRTSRSGNPPKNTDQAWRRQAARTIAVSLQNRLGRKGAAQWHATASAVKSGSASYAHGAQGLGGVDPDTLAVARAIQQAIKRRGTKPHHYMGAAVPTAEDYLHRFVAEALPDRGSSEGGDGGSNGNGEDGAGNG